MIPLSLAELATVTGGRVVDADPTGQVVGAAFVDSRHPVPGGLFVAVEGERVDGHDFAAAAVAAGAAAVLARRPVGAPAVVVEDPVRALAAVATYVVARLPDLVRVGITGSQGKTSTKDLLGQVLAGAGETVAPEGSFNNEIGLPLTVLRATPSSRYLVIEMGARRKGDIRQLAAIARPDVGLVLNVGVAHLGEFGSRDAIAVAKGELVESLPAAGLAVLNADDPRVSAMRARTAARVLTFGTAAADVTYGPVALDESGRPRFAISYGADTAEVQLALVGAHQAANAAAAAAAALGLGLDLDLVADRLRNAKPLSRWRMEVHSAPAGVTVINDAYNANPDSMTAALQTLAELGRRRPARTVAVLGEMRELGPAAGEAHVEVGRLVARLGVDRLLVVGEAARGICVGATEAGAADGSVSWAADQEAAGSAAEGLLRPGDIVLVKASRVVGLESLADRLARHGARTTAEADR